MKRFVETMHAACAMNEPRIIKKHFTILRLTATLLVSLMFVGAALFPPASGIRRTSKDKPRRGGSRASQKRK